MEKREWKVLKKNTIMVIEQQEQIETTLAYLYNDAKYDILKAMKGFAKNPFRPINHRILRMHISLFPRNKEKI